MSEKAHRDDSSYANRKRAERNGEQEKWAVSSWIASLTRYESAVIYAQRIVSNETQFYNLLHAIIERLKELRPETDFSTDEAIMLNRASLNDALAAAVISESLEFEEGVVISAQTASKEDHIKWLNERQDKVRVLARNAPTIPIEVSSLKSEWVEQKG